MTDNYYCVLILVIFIITMCMADDNLLDDADFDDLEIDQDVCSLPIDEGSCGSDSLSSSDDQDKATVFGYNNYTMKCEEFIYDGCGGNANRFSSSNECRNACYTPLKYFLARVTEFLMYKYTSGNYNVTAT